jgi:hypothetical protein
MIIHVNFLPKPGDTGASEVIASLAGLLDQGRLDGDVLSRLRLHLDWLQYKANFREPITVRHASGARGEPTALAELAIDVRRVRPERLADELARAIASVGAAEREVAGRAVLEDWTPLSRSAIWQFNRLFWQRLTDWEHQSGRGFEAALPSGRSDANHPAAVADAVADFWTLLVELDKRGQLPPEIFALEIGVGPGTRAGLWLDRFKALDEARGTG